MRSVQQTMDPCPAVARLRPRDRRSTAWSKLALAVFASAFVAVFVVTPASPSAAQDTSGWSWFKTDTHVHSSGVSPDAAQDLGVMSQAAKAQGLNAIFLSDHGAGSNNPVGGVVVKHVFLDDDYQSFMTASYGTLTVPATNQFESSPSPVRTGSKSLHMKATSSGYGEAITWFKRGPNLRSGDLILKFSVYPTQIDAGSGIYVSVAIGGDSTLNDAVGTGCDSTSGKSGPPNGYTTQGGTISPGKTNVLVWQLGTPRTASSNPDARVLTYPLSYNLNQWNDYTINVTQALNDIPLTDRPSDYDALTALKIVAAGNGGTADANIDSYSLDASAPQSNANEFIYRNSIVHQYDTSTFKVFPGLEAGTNSHVSRFNYDISTPSEYKLYNNGTLSIPDTQATGYPTQVDHPGLPGGATKDNTIASQGYGSDAIEAAPRGQIEPGKSVMIETWDGILQQNVPMIGAWSSDAHRTDRFGQSTSIYAPSLTFDSLIRSYFEGREFMANNNFPGQMLYNVDASSAAPYPARYPIYVSSNQSAGNVHLKIAAGAPFDGHVVWVRNGTVASSDTTSGTPYEATKSFALGGAFTYVRAELRNASDVRIAMTEPIFFESVPSLPNGMSFHVDGVQTADGKGYTKAMTKGITASSYDSPTQTLSLTLRNPANALATVLVTSPGMVPQSVELNGATVGSVASQTAFDDATGSAWFYDAAGVLHAKTLDTNSPDNMVIAYASSTDVTAPSTPTGVTAIGGSPTEIDLGWNPSIDDVGVTGYHVFRDASPTPIATVMGVTGYIDTGLQPDPLGSTHTYTVSAFDAATNESTQSSPPVSAMTMPSATTSFTSVADAYVTSTSPTTNFGTGQTIKVDGSPTIKSYLRFNVAGLTGTVAQARLRIYAKSPQSPGYDVSAVSNNAWSETGITYNNAPAPATSTASSGTVNEETWTTVDVTPLVTGNGTFSFAISTTGSAALSLASREATNPPQLVISTVGSGGNQAPTAGPVTMNATSGVQASWTPVVSDPDAGDTLTCSIVSQPAHGTASVQSNCSTGTYTSDVGYTGSDSFTYEATDTSNASSSPASVSVTVAGGTSTTTFTPVADSYVDSSLPTSNFGTSTALRVDNSPTIRTYLKFTLSGLTGTVNQATLRVFATSAQSTGYDVFAVADTSWIESGAGSLNYNNAPPLDATKTGSSGPVFAGTWTTVNVTPLVTGNGTITIALTTTNTTALAMQSRTGTNPPQLIATT